MRGLLSSVSRRIAVVCLGLLLLACFSSQGSESEPAMFVMLEGEGAGERADAIADQVMLADENGVVPTLVSAEHVAIIELPTQTLEFVIYEVADGGSGDSCLLMVAGDLGEGGWHGICDDPLSGEVSPLIDDSDGGGAVRSLLVLVSPETSKVVVFTDGNVELTAQPANRLAYVEWPADQGYGIRVTGLDGNGDELWSRPLEGVLQSSN